MTTTSAGQPIATHTLYGETMGTRWRADLCAPRTLALDALHGTLQARLDTIVAQMSSWEAGSDLSHFNRAAAGSWHVLPDDFRQVIARALRIARDSDGAFDPTLGRLVAAWGFGAQGHGAARPDAQVLDAARRQVGWQTLQFRDDSGELLQPGGIALDLSAIAKGYGVDVLVDLLRAQGITAALVDVGGELRGYGRKPDGSPWRVLVETGDEDADAAAEDPCILQLDGIAVATSGPRWHRHLVDGEELAHTIDPRSARPVRDPPRAVSVIARDAMDADAWSTALTVMGVEAGFAFATAHGLAARFVPRKPDATARSTPAFDTHVVAA